MLYMAKDSQFSSVLAPVVQIYNSYNIFERYFISFNLDCNLLNPKWNLRNSRIKTNTLS